ncbi:fimbrial biogenesis chaperone [Luteibacter yeojuensis]
MFRAIPILLATAVAVCPPSARAAVVIGGTRVVFPAQSRDVSVRIENKGDDPALVQVWVDDGDELSTPSTARAPFAITPPLFRIDPGQRHALRIVHVGDENPRDREVLYWLNVLEIPPKASGASDKNVLQLAFRHRLKLFHRPQGLAEAPDRVASTLRWSIEQEADASHLRVANPSSYHVSFNSVQLRGSELDGKPVMLGGGMVKPGGSTRFSLPRSKPGTTFAKVAFVTINDYGAAIGGSAAIGP